MTTDKLLEIDIECAALEDVLHGEEGKRITLIRNKLASLQPKEAIEGASLVKLLQEVLDYNLGNGKYNFSRLPEGVRQNESFDAWMDIKNRIEITLRQLKEK